MSIKLPKKPFKGLKVYCHRCKRDNPKCKHYDLHKFKVRVHVSGTINKVVSKVLVANNYPDAVTEAILFEKALKENNFNKVKTSVAKSDYSIAAAVIKYRQYLCGEHEYSQYVKDVTKGHIDEQIRYCRYFCNVLKQYKNLALTRITDVNKQDVAKFYTWSESHFGSNKSFNKCMGALKAFFNFLIEIEDITMKNPFSGYTQKSIKKKNVETLTKAEFDAILDAVGTTSSHVKLGGKGGKKNFFKPYLVLGFKLFLLTGLRREEVINLKWCHIITSINGVKFFSIGNQKVNLQKNTDVYVKYIPINEDLMDLLNELGYNEKRNANEYIMYPDRNVTSKTIMDNLSKAFTHYRKNAGIEKPISLNNLRKTYITWLNRVIGNQTGVLTSHSGEQVLKDHYIDTRVLTTIEEAALKVKIFG